MTGIISLGILIIFIGIIVMIIGITSQGKTDSKFFAGGVIGFIPFGFANDKKMLYFGLAITAILFLIIFFNLR